MDKNKKGPPLLMNLFRGPDGNPYPKCSILKMKRIIVGVSTLPQRILLFSKNLHVFTCPYKGRQIGKNIMFFLIKTDQIIPLTL